MHRFTRHLRGLLVALATLALSAGVVLAVNPADQKPAGSTHGVVGATGTSGQTVATEGEDGSEVDEDEAAEAPEVDEDQDAEAPEVDEDQDAEAPKTPEVDQGVGGEPAPSVERTQNHGWFVSQAAKGVTPASSANHGQYVSGIAHSDAGKSAAKAAKAAKAPKVGNH